MYCDVSSLCDAIHYVLSNWFLMFIVFGTPIYPVEYTTGSAQKATTGCILVLLMVSNQFLIQIGFLLVAAILLLQVLMKLKLLLLV